MTNRPLAQRDTLHGDVSSNAVLELSNVSAGYGSTTILRNVSFSIPPGQVVALLGSNGAGKTTTLRTAAGVLRPTVGAVRLEGVDVTDDAPYRRAAQGVCLIPEGRGVFRSLTVRENLRLQLGEGRSNLAEAFERAFAVFPALSSRMNDIAGRLSGGQQQMLALARAYVGEPKVILLDEVSMGLAPRIVDEIFAALHELAERGIAMLLVEQYVTRAMEMADAVVLLNKGVVTYDGPPGELDEEEVLRGYLGGDFTMGPGD
ncbi:ABC transporter ATP-binding protein [Nocardia vinacea]|uniref:ABC transporter ATP-binding protein n=1 Tax=Nocardia vinacea TaxID=96468 RepID=UPI000308A17C|nr:ABC transporter ATP-binding protein [Nocardia vinacea]